MVLDNQRENIDPVLSFFAKIFIKFKPDTLTWMSVVFAFFAGLFFYFSDIKSYNYFLLIGSLFVFLNGLFDAIDGKVAKLTNQTSKKGDFLDHALDRYADVFILAGLALSGWCDTRIGIIAIIGMLLTSYMGTQSQAVGYKRNYSGLLGRADRIVLLIVFPVIAYFVYETEYFIIWKFNVLEIVLIYFALMGNITAIQRFICTLRWFNK